MAITQVSNSLVKQDLTISGGTVDNTVIGSGTPAAGTFTTITGTLASTVTGTTATASDNSTKIATTAYVTTALANLVDSAPGTLNTLNELAAALGDDANFSTTVTSSIAAKAPLAGATFTGDSAITKESPAFTLTDSSSSRTLLHFVDDNNSVIRASGPLLLQSGGAVSAITLDTSQNATFAGATTINGGNPALVLSNSGDAKINFVRSSNTINYAMSSAASGGHGFYDNSASAYDLYMKAGNVGIGGTTTPAYTLTVEKSVTGDWLSRFYNTGTAEGDMGVLLRTGSEHDGTSILSLYSGSSYKFKFQADGKLGIGTTTVHADLHLGAASPHIDIGPSSGNRGKVGFDSNNVYIGSSSGTGEIHFKNNIGSTDAPHSSGDTKMVITDSAVGIGTSSVTSNLGWNRFLLVDGGSSNAVIVGGTDGQQANIGAVDSLYIDVYGHSTATNNNIVFRTQDANSVSSGIERMRIDSNGDMSMANEGEIFFNANSSSQETRLGWKYTGSLQSWIERDHSAGALVFGNQGSERMRIDSSGNVSLSSGTLTISKTIAGSNDQEMLTIRRVGGSSSDGARQASIAFFDGANNTYTGKISGYRPAPSGNYDGGLRFYVNPHSTNSNATFAELNNTPAMYLNPDRSMTTFGSITVPSGSGIFLGGTASANQLDDFEEGTWTPSFTAGGHTITQINFARYTKVKNFVQCICYVSIGGTGNGANLTLAGLPFAVTTNAFGVGTADIEYVPVGTYIRAQSGTSQAIFLTQAGSSAQRTVVIGTQINVGYAILNFSYYTS